MSGFLAAAVLLGGCAIEPERSAEASGDSRRGASAIGRYGCGTCHAIHGIPGAHGKVGPPLSGLGSRLYIAGILENTPYNIARWVEHPHSFNERTVMPELGVTTQDATDIAAYLNSLK
jgi:cytochrome c2